MTQEVLFSIHLNVVAFYAPISLILLHAYGWAGFSALLGSFDIYV